MNQGALFYKKMQKTILACLLREEWFFASLQLTRDLSSRTEALAVTAPPAQFLYRLAAREAVV
jgi:hypothetical protein